MMNVISHRKYIIKETTSETISAYFMLAPSYILYIIFVLVPIAQTIYFSFTNYDLYQKNDFIGLANYFNTFKDSLFIQSFGNTMYYVLLTLPVQICLGIVLAVLFNKKLYGSVFHRACFFIPNVTPIAAMSMVWLWIYEPSRGVLNAALGALGLPQPLWLYDTILAMPAVAFTSVWKDIGYKMIITLAALQRIPEELYEAARVDGAPPITQFFKITVPMLQPTIFFLVVTGVVRTFNVFEQVNILTNGGPMNTTTTILHQIYNRAFSEFKMGYACALSVVLIIFTVIVTAANFKLNEGQKADIV